MKGTPLTDQTVDYIIEHFPSEDNILRDLREAAIKAGIPEIQISPEQGAFMQVLLRGCGARRVLEIGTLAGYSSIIMGRALPEGGKLITIEVDPFRAEVAREFIRRAELQEKIEVKVGSGVDLLERELAGTEPFDFAFIDADKPSYTRYLELIFPLMRRGGLIAGDNALAWGNIADGATEDPDVRGMQAFNQAMAVHPGLQSCIVPIGDGMCIGVVL